MSYTYADLLKSVANNKPYANIAQSLDMRTIINDGVRIVTQQLDLASCKRKYSTQINLFDEIYSYSCPQDIKGQSIIDLKPQLERDPWLEWILTTPEEFDRRKTVERNLISIESIAGVKRLDASIETSDMSGYDTDENQLSNTNIKSKIISLLDYISDNGSDWKSFGDAINLRIDSVNFIKGNASIEFDISGAGGVTAGIYNNNLSEFDITNFVESGFVFVFARINSAVNITNYKIRIGVDASNYYEMTATNTVEGLSFASGWNLIRFDFSSATLVGTVDKTMCKYCSVYITKDAGKINEIAYGFDQIQLKAGNIFDMIYYSEYPWQTNLGVYIKSSTADTDILNAGEEEYSLMVEKVKELMFSELREYNQITLHRSNYTELVSQYRMNNPSESKILNTTYYEIN